MSICILPFCQITLTCRQILNPNMSMDSGMKKCDIVNLKSEAHFNLIVYYMYLNSCKLPWLDLDPSSTFFLFWGPYRHQTHRDVHREGKDLATKILLLRTTFDFFPPQLDSVLDKEDLNYYNCGYTVFLFTQSGIHSLFSVFFYRRY